MGGKRRSALVLLAALPGVVASCSLTTSSSEGKSGPCPAGMAHITTDETPRRSFCIDRWEGSVVEIKDRHEVNHSPYEPVTSVLVEGQAKHTSLDLLAAWLGSRLRCPTQVVRRRGAEAITRVTLERKSGPIILDRPDGRIVTISQPGKPDRRVALPIRTLSEALIEELRRLDPDEIYGEVLTKGLQKVGA